MSCHEKLRQLLTDIQLVWHGLNDPLNIDYFVQSPIPWGEADLRKNGTEKIILRHDSFETHPLSREERLLDFEAWLKILQSHGKKIVVDLKEGHATLRETINVLQSCHLDESALWLNVNLRDISMDEASLLRKCFPRAVLASVIPLRFMFQQMSDEERSLWFNINHGLGVTRLSASWRDSPAQSEISLIKDHGFEVNLYHVDTVSDLFHAASLRPHSITSDFHFPEWNLFGRGSGENGVYFL